jgi:cytochrome b pre-mRNA-processing protein 3
MERIGRNRGVMLLDRLFRPRPSLDAGRALYVRAVERSRGPALYGEFRVPDTVEGRFEAYTLHVVLLLDRLRGLGPEATDVSQALFDTYVGSLDHALREMGVGDLSVGRKMRKLGEAFYGRARSYDAALAALPDEQPLHALLARTVYAGAGAEGAPRLAAYLLAQRAALRREPDERLLAGEVAWEAP